MKQVVVIAIALLLMIGMLVGCSSSRHERVSVEGTAAAARDTARARELNEKAYQLIEQEKFADAEKLLRDAVAADAMFGPARNNLGLVYYHTDHLYEAAWEFENAIRLMPYQ